jgi:2-keto-4-pentenoate hydratase
MEEPRCQPIFKPTKCSRRSERAAKSRPDGQTLNDAYRVSAMVDRRCAARGERKLGFTNRTIWEQYNVYAPIWGYVYDCRRAMRTIHRSRPAR